MSRHPVIVSYRSVDDLKTLKDWFYNFDDSKDNRYRAIQRVKALTSRGRLPHGIESTSLLTSICLQEVDANYQLDSNILQLSYSSAIIRFVNGLLDPFQQSNYAIPLHLLAKSLNLPSFFVELRHMSTHENLPSLEICRIACTRALNWLYDNYWCHIEDEEEEDDEDDDEGQFEALSESTKAMIDSKVRDIEVFMDKNQIQANLKVYKKIRKSNLDLVYKYGDSSSETAIKYNKIIKDIKKSMNGSNQATFVGSQILILILIYNDYLIYNFGKLNSKKLKFNSLLIKLYKPLLNELGLQFKLQLFLCIINIIKRYFNEERNESDQMYEFVYAKLKYNKVSHPFEVVQLLEWLHFLVLDIISYDTKTDFKFFIATQYDQPLVKPSSDGNGQTIANRNTLVSRVLQELNTLHIILPPENTELQEIYLKLFENLEDLINNEKTLKNLFNKENKDVITETYKQLKVSLNTRLEYVIPTLEDILGESQSNKPLVLSLSSLPDGNGDEPPRKKKKKIDIHPNHTKQHYLFEVHDDWEPTPFGTFV